MTNDIGVLRPRPQWRRSEGAVLLTAFLCCILGGVAQVDNSLGWPPPVTYVVAALSCAALLWRHRQPVAVLAATIACGMLVTPVGLLLTPLIVVPAVIASYALAIHLEWRPAAAFLLVGVALLVATASFSGALSWQDGSRLGSVVALPLVAGILGHATRNRRAYLAAVEERAQRAEQSRDVEARRRVAEERLRIARELHDVVAHQITLANAQATVASHLFDSQPERTRKNLDSLVETTSNALDDLRATVGLLRQSDDPTAPAEPAPGLSRLETLVGDFCRAGLDVTVTQEGTPRPLPPGVDLTAYRIIQEALTNVTKHSGTRRARVGLAWGRNRVGITVANDAPSGGVSAAAPGSGRAPGFGLIGMRERATAVGGEMSAGRSEEGGFLVSVMLPVPPRKETQPADTEKPQPATGSTSPVTGEPS